MGTISSGVGLISGIDIQGVVNQLIAIEARPRQIVEQRVAILQAQKTALLDVNARVLATQTASKSLGDKDLFEKKLATSSNPSALTATASNKAAVGTYSLTIDRLVSAHQLITRGFADADTTPVGATTLRFESNLGRLDRDVRLNDLNGFAGVSRGNIKITDRSGATATIDLTRAVSLNDVLEAINNSTGVNVTAAISGDNLTITDNTGSTATNLIIQDLGGTTTASDLGIAGNSGGTNTLTGSQTNRIANATVLTALNDGLGVRTAGSGLDDFRITLLDGSTVDVSLSDIHNDGTNIAAVDVEDVVTAINTAAGANLTASIAADGVSLLLTDNTGGGGTLSVAALNSSNAHLDLGLDATASGNTLDGNRLIAAINSKLIKNLNGGSGVTTLGTLDITDRAANNMSVDISSAQSVFDIINLINAQAQSSSVSVTASLNTSGNGVLITDSSGSTANNLIVTDASGTAAADLGLDTTGAGVAANSVDGGDIDVKYLSEATRLEDLNAGRGVKAGKFKITDRNGVSATVDLTQGNEVTLADVIAEINSRPTDIVASINATGDGILLTDTSGGTLNLKVEESGSTTAADLGLIGDVAAATLDGSFEKTVDIDADDTLNDVRDKVNAAGLKLTASVVNDGSSTAPYRLSFTSTLAGEGGRILFDDGGLDFNASTLVEGEDAVVFYGSSNPAQALLVTNYENALTETIDGVTVDLLSATSQAVELTVSRDNDSVVKSVGTVVAAFNSLIDTINKYDTYNQETEERGLLLGDATLQQIRSRIYRVLNGSFDVDGQFQYLSQVGLTVGDGAKLKFDEAKFKNALSADPAAVKELMTLSEIVDIPAVEDLPDGVTIPGPTTKLEPKGFGLLFEDTLKKITDNFTGLMTLRTNSIDNQIELSNDRIEQMTKLLEAKRQRLEAEFFAMERALSQLQAQQSSLSGLAQIAARSASGGGGGATGFGI